MSDEIQMESVSVGGGTLKRFAHEGGLEKVVLLVRGVGHGCPFADETDWGTVDIAYEPRDWLVEVRSLTEYLEGFEETKVSHEEFAQIIAADLGAALECQLTVTTTYKTADVTVSARSEVVAPG